MSKATFNRSSRNADAERDMARGGGPYASPGAATPRAAHPWRAEDPFSVANAALPRLRAQCVASFTSRGHRVRGEAASASMAPSMELEVDAKDPRIVSLVHRGSHIVDRTFCFDAPVIDVALAYFRRERLRRSRRRQRAGSTTQGEEDRRGRHGALLAEEQPCVCILARSDCVSVFAPNGENFDVALPFHADRLVALPTQMGGGLLLQRRPLTPAPSAAATAAAFSPSAAKSPPGALRAQLVTSTNAMATRPRYFTLAHPLEEVKPVALSSAAALGGGRSKQTKGVKFLADPALDIVGVCSLPTRARNRSEAFDGDGDGDGDVDSELQGGEGVVLACFHRHERRFVVYEVTQHRAQQDTDTDAAGSPPAQLASPFVSPAKARQQQREAAMVEQYFKSHIVPDRCVRLVWTSPCLDALADAYTPETSDPSMSRGLQSVFLLSSGGEDADSDYSGDTTSQRLALVDERYGVLLIKPLRVGFGESSVCRDRDTDLHVIQCQTAVPVSLMLRTEHPQVWTDAILSSRDGSKLYLYSTDRIVSEVVVPERLSTVRLVTALGTSDCFQLCPANGRSGTRRYAHPLQVLCSPLLASVFDVLQFVLPATEFLKIKIAVFARHSYTDDLLSDHTDDDGLWSTFGRVMLACAGNGTEGTGSDESIEHGARKKARATLDEPHRSHQEAAQIVNQVLGSAFAKAYHYQNGNLLPGVEPTDLMPTADSLGSSTTPTNSASAITLSEDTLCLSVIAIHLLHEDCRLSLSRSFLSEGIARFMFPFCVRLGLRKLAAYYQAQYASLFTTKNPQPSSRNLNVSFDDDSPAPSVFLWLRERLQAYSVTGLNTTSRLGGTFGSFEPVTSVSPSPFPRLRSASEWRQADVDRSPAHPLWRTEAVCRVFELLFPDEHGSVQIQDDITTDSTSQYDLSRLSELMDFLAEDLVGRRLGLEDLPIGIRLIILEAIRVYKENPPHEISEEVCKMIGRRDLAGFSTPLEEAFGGGTSGSLVESTRLRAKPNESHGIVENDRREVSDGLNEIVVRSQRLFPHDQRLKEVARLLRSNRPLCLRLEKTSDMSDQDYMVQQQARLLLLCKRSMGLSVARGMVTFGTFDMTTVQNQAWQLTVPSLPLAGRTPPTNATVMLDVSGYAKELTHWPQFHNGCATGLRLPAQDLSNIVTRYWIKYHRPSAAEFQRMASQAASRGNSGQPSSTNSARNLDEAHAAHAGVLLGLGLNGHLKCLSMADVYNYLSLSNEFVTVAILLGMATTAARSRRTRSAQSSASALAAKRRLQARITSTAPDMPTQDDPQLPTASQAAVDVDMEANIDASAMTQPTDSESSNPTSHAITATGVELSLERSVSKMLCLHIPSLLPAPFAEFSVPASTQTAALLGLGVLYQGTGHRLMTELLLTEVTRSPASPQFLSNHSSSTSSGQSSGSTPFDQHEGYSLAAGLALGLVLLGRGGPTSGDPGLADLGLEEKLYKFIVGGAAQPPPQVGVEANATGTHLYRGRKWKPFGSASGGAHLNGGASAGRHTSDSNKVSMGDRASSKGEYVNIGVTATGSALALAFMYLKSGNRSIASQLAVPDTLILLDYVRPDILLIRTLAKNLVLWDAILPTTPWIEKHEVPAQLFAAYKALQGNGESMKALPDHVDIRSICESYANIVAGACLAMGLRFAGTANDSARETLRHFVLYFRELRSRSALLGGDVVAAATDRVTIERCLAVCAQALALVDAGTGNLESLTLLRSVNLRQRVDNELTYGNHMALSMSIGLLFLGGGRATVSRSNEAIAALVVSLYPMSAMNTADNKYHLQAFRHLYVLAVDSSRYVETIDTSCGEPCSVEIRVDHIDPKETNGTRTTVFKTPCLLPELDSIERIVVVTAGFYPVDIHLHGHASETSEDAWAIPRTGGTKTTANDTRVKLLLEKSQILLERRQRVPQVSATLASQPSTSSPTASSPAVAVPRDAEYLPRAFKQYFDAPWGHRADVSPESAWWNQKHVQWGQWSRCQLVGPQAEIVLPTHLSVVYEVFAMQHPHRSLDSLSGLWNLKLVHEFYRIDPFASLEKELGESEDTTLAARRDFIEWVLGQTEEAFRHRWRVDASSVFPSLSSVHRSLLEENDEDDSIHASLPLPDSLLLSSLFVLFDAPPSVFNSVSDWKRRMRQAMAAASQSHGASSPGQFAVDRFLLHTADHITKDEQTFWLRVVSFFLFSV